MKRVVVTGMGAITPIGNSVEEFWNGIKEQKIGFAPITYFDATEYKAHLAAEVKGFNAKDYMSPKAARRMELFSQYAVAATKEAIEDAGLDLEKEDTTRIGVSVGCGVGSLQMIETTTRTLDKKGPNRVKPSKWAARTPRPARQPEAGGGSRHRQRGTGNDQPLPHQSGIGRSRQSGESGRRTPVAGMDLRFHDPGCLRYQGRALQCGRR